MSKRYGVYLSILLFSIFAQGSDDLDVIEVRAAKDPAVFNFGSSTKIDSADLESKAIPQISPLIDAVPGVVSSQNGGPGGRVSFFVRGTESRHLSFTLDGLKLNDVSNVDRQFDAAFLTSPILKELTVFKGPQAVLFGSDAFGGLIQLQTRKGENAPETRLHFSGGSFGTVSGSISSDWKKSGQQGTLTYNQSHSDGISRLNEKRFDAKEKDSSDITQITSSSAHKWDKNQTDLLFSFINGKNELDGSTSDNSHDHSQNQQYIVQQKTSRPLTDNLAVSLRNGLNRHQRFINSLSSGRQSFQGNSIQNEVIVEKKSDALQLMGGMSSDHEGADVDTTPRSFDLQSAFLQSLLKLGDFSFQAGGRFDHHSKYGNFETGSSGLIWKKDTHKFFVQYSQGFKAPSVYQLYVPVYGNKALVPERNHSWEGGWALDEDMYGMEVVLFQNRLSNLITFAANNYQNQGKFIAEGVELSGRISYEQFSLRPSFVHQAFRNNANPVLGRPGNMGSLQASWFATSKLELFTKYRWYSARNGLDPNALDLKSGAVKLNGFESTDVGVHYQQGPNDWTMQIINVLDRNYEELYGYSVMPLSVFVGYGRRISF